MGLVRLALITALSLFAVGCASTGRVVAPGAIDTTVAVGVAHISDRRILVHFYPSDTEYTHVVQEIDRRSGDLVECFRWDGYIRDRHAWPESRVSEFRRMTVYAANVEGADETPGGFAHLPDNGEGFKTTVGPGFNSDYQAKHETRGRITKRSPHETTWTIEAEEDIIVVTTASGLRIQVGPEKSED